MAEKLTRALGDGDPIPRRLEPRPTAAFGFPGADDLGNMFQVKRDFNEEFCAPTRSGVLAESEPGDAGSGRLAGGEREPDSAINQAKRPR
jgi:hypothetical protein